MLPSLPVGRIMPIIFFVIPPAVFIVITVVLLPSSTIYIKISTNSHFYIKFQPTPIYEYFITSIYVYLMIAAVYGLKRPDSIEKYLKQGVEQAVVEFETLKKILIVELPITSIVVILNYYFNFIIHIYIPHFPYVYIDNFSSPIMLSTMSAGIGGLFMYGRSILKKEFRFYLSKTCFKTALHKKDIFKQMYYFSLGLQEYDKYLKRHLKHQIKDIDKIFSNVSLLDNETKTEVIRSLSDSFETENDKLEPLKYISSELAESEDIESFLISESLKSQLKVVGAFLAALIPIMISIITLMRRQSN